MNPSSIASEPIRVWGVPFQALTYPEAIDRVEALIRAGRASYFVTANLNYMMLVDRDPSLREVSERAAFVVADGITLVWVSRWMGTPLPERVTGSDLIYGLCRMAAERKYKVFLMGGAPGVAEAAACRLKEYAPGLRVVGTESPPFRELTPEEQEELLARIRAAAPDLLFVAMGQPKGERWIAEHVEALGVPVCVQVGAGLDFVAGRVRRAPVWIQRLALETPFRIAQEPRRLGPRYARNAAFLIRQIARDVWPGGQARRKAALRESNQSTDKA